MRFSMAPDSLLPLIVLCSFLISLSVACPESFHCGHLGELHFPFTTPECPQSSGLVPIRGCDDPKAAKLVGPPESQRWEIKSIHPQYGNVFKILDHDLHDDLLSSHECRALANNLTRPPLTHTLSFNIVNNITLFKCDNRKSLHIRAPENYYFNYTRCSDDYTYFFPNTIGPMVPEVLGSFSQCSVIQLPFKPPLPDYTSMGRDPFTFLTAEIVIEVELSGYCFECHFPEAWQCLIDEKCLNFTLLTPEHKRSDSVAVLRGVAIGGAGVIAVGFFIILLLRNELRRKSSGLQNQSRDIESDTYPRTNPESGNVYFGVPVFSYEELEEATDKFDQSRELGNGGFGTVYYGKLKDGREVAIKRLFERSYRRVDQFKNEVKILTRLHHKNLVSLYGCTSRDSRELLLVYEYIPNGTLGCHLHGNLTKPGSLPWPVRMRIAIETANALSYLHACDIIHRDVKTSNILLDNYFCVKVADFGLSRLFPRFVSHVSTAPAGSPGYLDPEYHQCYQLTNKSDVYSLGVVLIEMISSMPAIDVTRNKDEIKLANVAVKKIQRGAFSELVDPSLGFESDNAVKRMIVSVAKLAFQCLQRNKELRPSMDEVLEVLQKIESGKDDLEHLELHSAGSEREIYRSLPTSMHRDGVGSLKNLKPQRLPKTL